ncbi:MAG: murein biosynthesis integral membrane protein MurJ, partial [Chloroflexi bacterium]|nr:murein biosynthesis integral membrane protein MurJ [Chloroflexota bacterium]
AAVEMLRLILPAIFFLGMSGVVTGLLYALKRFTFPAFTTALYNLGIVVVALALTPRFGITSLVIGILIGSLLQLFFQLPGLRGMKYYFAIEFAHPALKKILQLYLPVLGGLTASIIGVLIDRNLASRTGAQSLAWMQAATVLVQLPLGLVGTAISFAILPTLSRQSTVYEFQSTLAFGIKLVLLLILPATIGLLILARPIVALLFEHGAFTAFDTTQTARALQIYLIGLPFAAIDQPLVFAFYARKNTLTPNLVAFAGVTIYLTVALALIEAFGMLGLVIANAAQLSAHALIMLWFTHTRLNGLGKQGLSALTAKVFFASLAMGLVAWVVASWLERGGANIFVAALTPILAASIVYLAMMRVLRVREAAQMWEMLAQKFRARQLT